MKQKSLPLPPLYSCGMNFKISKFNNHFSQQLNSKAEKKKRQWRNILLACLGKLEIFYWHSELLASYINAYIVIINFGTYLSFLMNTAYVDKDQCSRNLLNQAFFSVTKNAWFPASWVHECIFTLTWSHASGHQVASPLGKPETST